MNYENIVADKLFEIVNNILSEMGIDYHVPELKDDRFNKYRPFKLSPKRMICYIQYENRTMPNDQFNFALRFKRGDNPLNWNSYLSENDLFFEIIKLYSNPWSQASGYPSNTWDDSGPTQQFGFTICEKHIIHPDFKEIVKFLIDVAYSAVKRNWEDYDTLTMRLPQR